MTAYEQVTRQMVNDIKTDIKEIKLDLSKLSNQYSRRLPSWASALFMVLTAIIGGLAGKTIL